MLDAGSNERNGAMTRDEAWQLAGRIVGLVKVIDLLGTYVPASDSRREGAHFVVAEDLVRTAERLEGALDPWGPHLEPTRPGGNNPQDGGPRDAV